MLGLSEITYSKLDFEELKRRFKSLVGRNYKLGLINDDEIGLYFIKDLYTESGADQIPFCQMIIKKGTEKNGLTKITFRIAAFALIAAGLVPIIFCIPLLLNETPGIVYYWLVGFYPFLYLGLNLHFYAQFGRFNKDLKQILGQ